MTNETTAPVAVLDGWKPVPERPTIEMVEAGYEVSLGEPDRSGRARVFDQYKAMLAAAPTPPAQQPVAWMAVPHNRHERGPQAYFCSNEKLANQWAYNGVEGCACTVRPLYAAPPAPEQDGQPAGTTSYQYRAELYDEVWQKARDMGYGNVTEALVALERVKVQAEQDAVKVLRGLLERIDRHYADGLSINPELEELRALLEARHD